MRMKILLLCGVVGLLASCRTITTRTEYVTGVDKYWLVGEYRNCTLHPEGVALMNCASEETAIPVKVTYKGKRAALGNQMEWECLREKDDLVCTPVTVHAP